MLIKTDEKTISTWLRDHRLKATAVRIKMIQILASEHGPFSVEKIHKKLKTLKCDLATIYRNFTVFEEAGVVHRIEINGKGAHFEFHSHQDKHHHHHVICKKCGGIEPFDHCYVVEAEKMVKKMGYINVTHSLEFYGLCGNCH